MADQDEATRSQSEGSSASSQDSTETAVERDQSTTSTQSNPATSPWRRILEILFGVGIPALLVGLVIDDLRLRGQVAYKDDRIAALGEERGDLRDRIADLKQDAAELKREAAEASELEQLIRHLGVEAELFRRFEVKKEIGARIVTGSPLGGDISLRLAEIREEPVPAIRFAVGGNIPPFVTDPGYEDDLVSISTEIREGCTSYLRLRGLRITLVIAEDRVTSIVAWVSLQQDPEGQPPGFIMQGDSTCQAMF